ncbi:hypothetical protein A4X09_0g6976 [Tilletia walkeri]|uniref:RING-type domain-containing protein n=1 Tax=Tilletia walkeri TaxID=117179 RepID=A0A8X7N1T4_9BASI|nr:hypothetical protein A4X09_0g6976 [Tilletia walkeri]
MGCSICFEGFGGDDDPAHRPVSLVPCGHILHQGCILAMLASGAARPATRDDVVEHRRAVEQRHKHQPHLERVKAATTREGGRQQQQLPQLQLRMGDIGGEQAEAGTSRSRLTLAHMSDLGMGSELRIHTTAGIIPEMTAVIICPLCKTVCPIHHMLDLWPSEHDDLEWFKAFVKRQGSGPFGTYYKSDNILKFQELFQDLAEFRQYLTAYVMYTENVELRLQKHAGAQVLQMIERHVPEETIRDQLKFALDALFTAAVRFSSAAQEHRERVSALAKREAELEQLGKILNEKDGKLARLSTQLARDQALVDSMKTRLAHDKIETMTKLSAATQKSLDLEQSEREARHRETQAKLNFAQGLAQRDEQCKALVEAAEARALKAEQMRDEAEAEAKRAKARQDDLGVKLRLMARENEPRKKEREERKKLEKENKMLLEKIDAIKQKYRRKPVLEPKRGSSPILLGDGHTSVASSSRAGLDFPAAPLADLGSSRGAAPRAGMLSRPSTVTTNGWTIVGCSAAKSASSTTSATQDPHRKGIVSGARPSKSGEPSNSDAGAMLPPILLPVHNESSQSRSRTTGKADTSSGIGSFFHPRSSTPDGEPSGLVSVLDARRNPGLALNSGEPGLPLRFGIEHPSMRRSSRSVSPVKVNGLVRSSVLGSSSSTNIDSKVHTNVLGKGKGRQRDEFAPGTARISTMGGLKLESMLDSYTREPIMASSSVASSDPPDDDEADQRKFLAARALERQRSNLPSSTSASSVSSSAAKRAAAVMVAVARDAMKTSTSRKRRSRPDDTVDSSLDVSGENYDQEMDDRCFPMPGMLASGGASLKRSRQG